MDVKLLCIKHMYLIQNLTQQRGQQSATSQDHQQWRADLSGNIRIQQDQKGKLKNSEGENYPTYSLELG